MTNATLLAMLRRRLRDVDQTAELYDDDTLWGYVGDVVTTIQSRKVAGASVITATDTGLAADVEDSLGLLIVLCSAALLLDDLYTDKVQRGEFGVSWKSGLEQESTIDARKAFADAVAGLRREADELTLIRASTTSGFRAQ